MNNDIDLFLLITCPLWFFLITIVFTMILSDFRAVYTIAIMMQGLFFIKLHREALKNG